MKITVLLFALLSATNGLCQLPSSHCDAVNSPLGECTFLTGADSGDGVTAVTAAETSSSRASLPDSPSNAAAKSAKDDRDNSFISAPQSGSKPGFHWGRALFESFTFLAIEQAYVVHDDYRWVVIENGVPFNHYWRDYKQSLSSWVHSGWNDGDPALYSYLGHPIQGALSEDIQIQNDPRGEKLEQANTKEYWHSRLRALLWNAVYSTQWNIGPLSEPTVEKYGAKARPPWNRDGSWPCTRKPCYTGVGQVDLVITPVGGFGWQLGEDFLDKQIARRVEGTTQNHFLIDVTRCTVSPIRGGANILHGKWPWYRASRDANEVYFSHQSRKHELAVGAISGAGGIR